MRKETPGYQPPKGTSDKTPLAQKMEKRRRGPSAGDERRREEFRRAAESMKGHKKT